MLSRVNIIYLVHFDDDVVRFSQQARLFGNQQLMPSTIINELLHFVTLDSSCRYIYSQ